MMDIPKRGSFPFGPPYNTIGIRVTNESDGEILPRNYSYWQNINAHAPDRDLFVFAGTSKGPCMWVVSKRSGAVGVMGPIFSADNPLSNSTAEGWYFHAQKAHILFCSDDEHLYRYDIGTKRLEVVVDITPFRWMGRFALRQWHSSQDGTVHSATVKKIVDDGPWPNIGTIVYREGFRQPWLYYEAKGNLDESQISRSGEWLLIKEDDDNRIIKVPTGNERIILDKDGAVGHSDNGWNWMVGADNWQQMATWRRWDFATLRSTIIYETPWWAQVLHVSCCDSISWVLGSGQIRDLIKIPLDGSMLTTPVAPKLSEGDTYDDLPKASLDPHGEYGFWIAFVNGRYDAFLVKINDV
jgi:hypothetical protein